MSNYRTGSVIVALLLCVVAASPVRAADAVIEAKRKAAAELLKEGKTADAIAMTKEVTRADAQNYRDHLLLARAYDKLNNRNEAVESYRRVLELLAPNDDRAVRAEVDRRLKALDAQTIKIQAAEEEFLKKLDALEREAIAARDPRAVERIFRLKGGVWAAQGRKDFACVEVQAASEWQGCGLTVTSGQRYRVRAVGTWTISPGLRCGADGVDDRPSGGVGAYGSLIAKVDNAPEVIAVGSNGTFLAGETGKLTFITAMPTRADRVKNSGSVFVVVEREQ